MILRNARLDDLSQVVAIEYLNFSESEVIKESVFKAQISTCFETFLVAEIDGKIAGYIDGQVREQRYLTDDLFYEVTSQNETKGYLIIISLSIHPEYQKQGIGSSLLAAFKDVAVSKQLKGISLTCHEELLIYYQMNGFKDEGESESQFAGEQWYNMVWENPNLSK